jgi:hypothetical protein
MSEMAQNGHGGAVTACRLPGAKRKTSTRDEYFPLRPIGDVTPYFAGCTGFPSGQTRSACAEIML